MRLLGFFGKVVLVLLLIGVMTGLYDVLSPGRRPESSAHVAVADSAAHLEMKSDVAGQDVLNLVLGSFCPSPACAGDFEGDVQGD